MAVLSEELYSPQSYIEAVTGEYYIFRNYITIFEEIRDILCANGLEDLYDYPLTEIDHIVENNINVVLVDVSDYDVDTGNWVREYRWFEVPEDFCESYEE